MTQTVGAPNLPAMATRDWRLARLLVDLVKYGFASAAALALDYGLLLLLHETFGVDYLVAAAIGFSSGLLLVYFSSVAFVFRDRRSMRPAIEFGAFVAVGIVGLVLNETLMYVFVEHVRLTAAWAKIPTAGFVFAFNFTARRALLFSAPSPGAKGAA